MNTANPATAPINHVTMATCRLSRSSSFPLKISSFSKKREKKKEKKIKRENREPKNYKNYTREEKKREKIAPLSFFFHPLLWLRHH